MIQLVENMLVFGVCMQLGLGPKEGGAQPLWCSADVKMHEMCYEANWFPLHFP